MVPLLLCFTGPETDLYWEGVRAGKPKSVWERSLRSAQAQGPNLQPFQETCYQRSLGCVMCTTVDLAGDVGQGPTELWNIFHPIKWSYIVCIRVYINKHVSSIIILVLRIGIWYVSLRYGNPDHASRRPFPILTFGIMLVIENFSLKYCFQCYFFAVRISFMFRMFFVQVFVFCPVPCNCPWRIGK